MERAKELFLKYNGSHFHMDREGDGAEYNSYHISRATEEMWAEEVITGFLDSKLQGREALRAYASVTEMIKCDNQNWEDCLYYPLRAEHLDDVTILYMLNASFRMAETAVRKHRFSREDADAYLTELNRYIEAVQIRAENGTMKRSADYTAQEFSDPVYIADYLKQLKQKWNELFH